MSETVEKTVEVQIFTTEMRDPDTGEMLHRGDLVTLPETRAEQLTELGAVGPKGTVEDQDQDAADDAEREARHQRIATGLAPVN